VPSDVGVKTVIEYSESSCISWSSWQKRISAEFSEFDSVTTISQASINSHFANLFESSAKNASILTEWSYKDGNDVFFRAVYDKAPRVQLVSSNSSSSKAILYLFVREGHIHPVDPDTLLDREDRLIPG
jgi:hypothetical protein